ncbi:MAG: class I SAM-dependent methyltransferase [Myxococcota bacterium]|nr:class I SAM-dependent methyltransferase [Myxococcota bacterium]
MAWYSWFSSFYDQALEGLYAPFREQAYAQIRPGARDALLLPCGTGQDLPPLIPRLAPGARLTCMDLDGGMIAKARARATQFERCALEFVEGEAASLGQHFDQNSLDLVVFPLGLSVIPEPEDTLALAWSRLRPGGQCLIFDCWARERTLATWSVELVAQADVSRTPFKKLEALAQDYEFTLLPEASPWTFGGELYVANAVKGE